MNNIFSEKAWDYYIYWQLNDKNTLKKINELIKDINRIRYLTLSLCSIILFANAEHYITKYCVCLV